MYSHTFGVRASDQLSTARNMSDMKALAKKNERIHVGENQAHKRAYGYNMVSGNGRSGHNRAQSVSKPLSLSLYSGRAREDAGPRSVTSG